MKKQMLFLLLFSCLAFGQGVQNIKGTSGSGAPSSTLVPGDVGSQYVDLKTGNLYVCTAITRTANALTCSWSQVGASTSVTFAGDLSGTSSSQTITGIADNKVYFAIENGLKCDGALDGSTGTDDTAALNTLLTTVHTNQGTVVFPPGKVCVFNSAEIVLPNNADSWTDSPGTISSQNATRWTCGNGGPVQFQQLMSSGATLAQIHNACVLDLRYNATHAKIQTLGMGHLEIDHLAIVDTSTDCAPFFFTSNTGVHLHDNAFIGSTISNGSTYSCTDAIMLGGSSSTPSKVFGGPYQGYDGLIEHNFFNQVQRAVYAQVYANAAVIRANRVWSQSGSNVGSKAAIEFASPVDGNSVEDNLIEVSHYVKGIYFSYSGNTAGNLTTGNSCYDAIGNVACVGSASDNNIFSVGDIYSGLNSGVLTSGDVITNFIGHDVNWGTTIHWNGYFHLIEQTASPNGTAGTSALWNSAFYERPVFTKSHLSTLNRVAALEEIPTTQVPTASDNFTRADAGTLGANWTTVSGLSSLQIASNKAEVSATSAYNGNYYSNVTFSSDQYSRCTLSSIHSGAGDYALCAVRIQSGADSLYALIVTGDGTSFCGIRKISAGSNTDLQACNPTHAPLAAGDQFTMTAVGSTLTAYMNGVQIATTTDTAFTGGSPGLLAFTGTVANVVFSSWTGGNMACVNGVMVGAVPGTGAQCSPVGGATSSIGGGALLAGACASTTLAVTNSTTSMAVAVSPNTYPGDGNFWFGYVSAAGTVTVKVCAAVAGTPTASTYNVRIIP